MKYGSKYKQDPIIDEAKSIQLYEDKFINKLVKVQSGTLLKDILFYGLDFPLVYGSYKQFNKKFT